MAERRPRWRQLAGPVGVLQPGEANSIADVAGVRVGHAQALSGEATGVSVIAPPRLPAAAGVATVNGTGELTGKLEIAERGLIVTPIYLCGTHAVGTVAQAAVTASGRGPGQVVIPVVGECDDGEMADSRTVVARDVERALAALSGSAGAGGGGATDGEVEEGSVGAGTGMSCFDYPGGIGTSSRRVGEHHVGVLLLCNFGERPYLDLLGTRLAPAPDRTPPHGSCIAVCATDAPLTATALRRLALRPLLGLARAGSFASEGSGEIGIAFSTAAPAGGPPGSEAELLDRCFAAAYEAAHESVMNCLVAARPVRRRDGSEQDPFPIDEVRRLAAEGRSL